MKTKTTSVSLLAAGLIALGAMTGCSASESADAAPTIPLSAGGSHDTTGSGGALAGEGTTAVAGGSHGTSGSGGALSDEPSVSNLDLDRDGNVMSLDCLRTGTYLRDANRARTNTEVSSLDRGTAYRGAATGFAEVVAETDNEALATALSVFGGVDDYAEFEDALESSQGAVLDACNASTTW